MKRLFLGLLLLLTVVGNVFADGAPTAVTEYSYEIVNDSGTAALTSIVPITSIIPKSNKITAFEVTPLAGLPGSECWGALFDDTALACTGEKIGEKEAAFGETASWSSRERPKKFSNGIVAMQGIRTRLTIYFIRE